MKVFCIIEGGWIQVGKFDPKRGNAGPEYGETHIVVDVLVIKNIRYFELEAWPGDQFFAAAFIPVEDSEEETEELIPISELNKYSPWPTDKAIKQTI